MATIIILGAGMMGTAMTIPLSDRGHDVRLVGTHLDTDIIEEIHDSRRHPKLRVTVPERVLPFHHLGLREALQGADLVILGVNSLGVTWAAEALAPYLKPDIPVLFLTKGLSGEGQRIQLLPDRFRESFAPSVGSGVPTMAIGGPSIAGELAARRETWVVLTGTDGDLLRRTADLLRTPYYHVWTSTDVIGVEVSVALKNLYALAVGLVAGLLEVAPKTENSAPMHNPAAAIFAQALSEMTYLVWRWGGLPSTVVALPGAGDLYVTCQGGRNARLGRHMGMGVPYRQAMSRFMVGETVEGAQLALEIGPTIEAMIGRGDLAGEALPLLRAVIEMVCRDGLAKIPWGEFFAEGMAEASSKDSSKAHGDGGHGL